MSIDGLRLIRAIQYICYIVAFRDYEPCSDRYECSAILQSFSFTLDERQFWYGCVSFLILYFEGHGHGKNKKSDVTCVTVNIVRTVPKGCRPEFDVPKEVRKMDTVPYLF